MNEATLPPIQNTTQPDDPSAERPTILVIDDELGPRESVRFLFKNEYNVHCADSVDAGIELLNQQSPDVIILDIKMPGKSGIEGLLEIREIEPDTSVIMLTGFGSLQTAQQAMRNGANDYVRKPFDTKEMREIVERHITRSRVEKRRMQAARELSNLNDTMRKELEEKQELVALGQRSSEIVHDLRNPLTVIYGYVQLLMCEMENGATLQGQTPDEASEYLSIIEKNVKRCDTMLQEWRDESRKNKEPDGPSLISISEALRDIVQSSQPIAKTANANLSLLSCPEGIEIMANATDLYRALQNLVTNAIQAVQPETGCVVVKCTTDNDKIKITVKDNGSGIPDDKLQDIFTPYFTTKKYSGGMGLGLYITRSIIEQHSGSLDICNNDGPGATATVRLPILLSR
ncbi:MAG: response regulator [Kiritimatiellae bacterium]|nr:response regulator [Kiritimatiellia bacterium]